MIPRLHTPQKLRVTQPSYVSEADKQQQERGLGKLYTPETICKNWLKPANESPLRPRSGRRLRIEDQGFRRLVEPKIVLEVAFNNIMRSDRHKSGYALRFPRIVRLRPDKLPEEADTIERAEEIHQKQSRQNPKTNAATD
jgi:hypothetical protein